VHISRDINLYMFAAFGSIRNWKPRKAVEVHRLRHVGDSQVHADKH
jgi:hypothetical protein